MITAVLFDNGGVILASPLEEIRAYEARAGLPRGFVQSLNLANPNTNAWACAERGEIEEDEFYGRLEGEARARGHELDARDLFRRISGSVRPEMEDAVREVRTRYRVACLTNNMRIGHGVAMSHTPELAATVARVMALFEHVIESCKLGVRKPEPLFYTRACELLGVPPEQCVFLDDLGQNLKPARALGMRTIKVGSSAQAITDLEAILGHSVRDGSRSDAERPRVS